MGRCEYEWIWEGVGNKFRSVCYIFPIIILSGPFKLSALIRRCKAEMQIKDINSRIPELRTSEGWNSISSSLESPNS